MNEYQYLIYIIENCKIAFDELCIVNKELCTLNSNADVNHLGKLNRIIQDYLIIRVGCLFDKSIKKLFFNNQEFKNLENEKIIKYIMKQRNRFVAHIDIKYIEKNWPVTSKICNSNLKDILERLYHLVGANK